MTKFWWSFFLKMDTQGSQLTNVWWPFFKLTLSVSDSQGIMQVLHSLYVIFGNILRESPKQCNICFGPINHGERKRVLTCGHEFHAECVSVWLKNNIHCPLCRAQQSSHSNKQIQQPQLGSGFPLHLNNLWKTPSQKVDKMYLLNFHGDKLPTKVLEFQKLAFF